MTTVARKQQWTQISTSSDPFCPLMVEMPRRLPAPYHGHEFAEMFWIAEGTVCHHCNGERQALAAGDLVFLRAEDRHEFQPDGMVRICFVMAPWANVEPLRDRVGSPQLPLFWDEQSQPTRHRLSAVNLSVLTRSMDEVMRLPRQLIHFDWLLTSAIRMLQASTADPRLAQLPPWLRDACLEAQSPRGIREGVRFLVSAANKTNEHVSRTMKTRMGITVVEYVNEVRIHYAATQLQSTNRRLTEIALDCGLDVAYFSRLFRKHHGVSPREFRRRAQSPPV